MLVISRKQNETLVINNDITITVIDVKGDKVRLGVVCPKEVPVHRQEVHDAIHGLRPPPPRPRPLQEQAFVQAVLETPDDEGIRLIFADWLEERGDPYGEFIRVQCELAKLPPQDVRQEELARREAALRNAHGPAWYEYLPEVLRGASFERGFVESVQMTAAAFLTHAAEIFASAPVRRLRVVPGWGVDVSTAALAASTHLARLAELDLGGLGVADADVAALAGSPHAAALRGLGLQRNRIEEAGAVALARSPYLDGLERLDVSGNQLGPGGVAVLQQRFGDRVRF